MKKFIPEIVLSISVKSHMPLQEVSSKKNLESF